KREHLGSRIIVNGECGEITNWANSDLPSAVIGGVYCKHVPRDQIKNVVNASELLHRFRGSFSWYMLSWMMIDIHSRLYPVPSGLQASGSDASREKEREPVASDNRHF